MDAQAYERIKCDVPNIVHGGVLPLPTGMWAEISQGLIGLSAYLAMLQWRKAGEVPQWLAELALTSLTAGTRPIARIARQSIGLQRWLRRAAASLDRAIPATSESQQLLARHAPDVVLTLPDDDLSLALESAAAQADLVRAAASLGVPTASIATGPDAQIHASLLQPGPSMVLVWNETQRDAVVRDGAISRDAVVVSGPLALERALTDTPLMTEQEFREAMGFPADRPFAFFCGSSGVLTQFAAGDGFGSPLGRLVARQRGSALARIAGTHPTSRAFVAMAFARLHRCRTCGVRSAPLRSVRRARSRAPRRISTLCRRCRRH